MTKQNKVPNPGSDEAIALGCLCPQRDNCSGKGIPNKNGSMDFWHSGDCPIHGCKAGRKSKLQKGVE